MNPDKNHRSRSKADCLKKPSIINNVETLATIPPILLNGADWYTQYGTPGNAGTKVFALAGNIENTGVIEVPLGMKVEDIIYKIGGGGLNGKEIKAVQLGRTGRRMCSERLTGYSH